MSVICMMSALRVMRLPRLPRLRHPRPLFRALMAAACAAVVGVGAGAPVALHAQSEVVIVSGLGGDPLFSRRFAALAEQLGVALHARFGVPDSSIVWLGEDSVGTDRHYAGRATKERMEWALRRAAARGAPQAAVILIGHGSGDGADTRLSVPGPDPTVADLNRWLAAFGTRRVAVVLLASGSGDAAAVLSAPNRVVITATKSAFERNESHFGEYFARALAEDGADTDKDSRISLLEAFRYAARETARSYESASKIQTEHPQLDDDGDHKPAADPTGRSGDGMLARRFFLDAGVVRASLNDPRVAALYAERFALEERVDALRSAKAGMASAAYDAALEPLLISLARKARELRVAEGRP